VLVVVVEWSLSTPGPGCNANAGVQLKLRVKCQQVANAAGGLVCSLLDPGSLIESSKSGIFCLMLCRPKLLLPLFLSDSDLLSCMCNVCRVD
jgi:hypothetical protein